DNPAPPMRTGAWWYGAMIPVQHQRDLYYPTWDTTVLICKGYPPFGAPAVDIPQSGVRVYWCRNGQGWQNEMPLPSPGTTVTAPVTASGAAVAAPTTSTDVPHSPTTPR